MSKLIVTVAGATGIGKSALITVVKPFLIAQGCSVVLGAEGYDEYTEDVARRILQRDKPLVLLQEVSLNRWGSETSRRRGDAIGKIEKFMSVTDAAEVVKRKVAIDEFVANYEYSQIKDA